MSESKIVDQANVRKIELQLTSDDTLVPMRLEYDQMFSEYLRFVLEEIRRLPEPLNYPYVFCGYTVPDRGELATVVLSVKKNVDSVIKGRGRRDDGQVGDWWWQTNDFSATAKDVFDDIGKELWPIAEKLGVDPMRYLGIIRE